MKLRESTLRVLDRVLALVPGASDEQPRPQYPDPNEPGLSPDEREARLEFMRRMLAKDGHGGYR